MNYFIFLAGLLYIGGAVTYFYAGDWKMGVAFLAYSLANFMFMMV